MRFNTPDQTPEFDNNSPQTNPYATGVLSFLALLIVVLVAHGRSLRGEFVLDDSGTILTNRSIRDLSNLPAVLLNGDFTTVAGRPLLNLSLAVNHAFGGVRPEGYHLVNYGIHAAVAWVLVAFLLRVFALFTETQPVARPLAMTIGLLWCVHPLTINAVSYISQRAESIASLFYLTVMWAFLKGVQTSRRSWIFFSVVAAWLGAFTKETIATVPFAVIALDVLLVSRDWRTAVRRHWGVYLGLMSSWIPLAICMWASKARAGTVGFGMGISLQDHLQTQIWALARYLRLFAWPHPLIFDYGDRFLVTDLWPLFTAACVLAAFGGLIAWLLIWRSPLAFCGIMYALLLAPTSVVPIATQTVAEHRMYLPSACLVALCTVAAYRGLLRMWDRRTLKPTMIGLFVSIFVSLSCMTIRHTRVLATRESVWTDTLQKHPTNQRAVFALAELCFDERDDAVTSERLCNRVIAMPGRYASSAYLLRGRIFQKEGKLDRAVEDFNQAITLFPDRVKVVARAYEHRGQVRAFQQELVEALNDFGSAISLNPQTIELYHQRAIVLRDLGRYEEARRDVAASAALDPSNINTELVHASIDIARGDLPEALRSFDRILARAPSHVGARRRRAWVYAKLDRWDDAWHDIRRLRTDGRTVDEELARDVEKHVANRRDGIL